MIEISTNAGQLVAKFEQAPGRISATIVKSLQKIGAAMQGFVTAKIRAHGYSGQRQDSLGFRTGTLARSLFQRLESSQHEATVHIGADLSKAPYARVHEYGGTITPKHGQYLTIPLAANLTASGVQRVSPKEFISNPGALGFERAFVNRRKTAIMGASRGGKVEPVFALKTSVTIPERSYLRSTLHEREAWILSQLQADTGEAVRDLGSEG